MTLAFQSAVHRRQEIIKCHVLEAKADFAAKLKENEARIAELQKQLAAKTEAPKP